MAKDKEQKGVFAILLPIAKSGRALISHMMVMTDIKRRQSTRILLDARIRTRLVFNRQMAYMLRAAATQPTNATPKMNGILNASQAATPQMGFGPARSHNPTAMAQVTAQDEAGNSAPCRDQAANG
jgi:hypothetical protein